MSQQFTIQSEAIRDKLNSLLPSQNLGSIGVELTGSTQIVPIVDLTEVSEGSSLREDLQVAQDFATEVTRIENATNTTIVNSTGFFRVDLTATRFEGAANNSELNIFDGTTSKPIFRTADITGSADGNNVVVYRTVVYLRAGDTLRGSTAVSCVMNVFTRQIADITGNLTNPQGFV